MRPSGLGSLTYPLVALALGDMKLTSPRCEVGEHNADVYSAGEGTGTKTTD
jgi:hypothetical protein